ncbi:MAG: CMD domain protein [Caldimonas sp.]
MTALDVSEDVIDRAAGLAAGDPLHAARRFRAKVVEASQASHHALVHQPVEGLSTEDRLRVAAHVCTIAGAVSLAQHYQGLLGDAPGRGEPPSPALPAMLRFAAALTTDPRLGDRAALAPLHGAGLSDAAIVALGQLVAFLAYQLRVVAGLKAMRAGRTGVAP